MGVRFCPGKRVLFRVEKTIDDDRVPLSRTSRANPRSFAIHYVRPGIYGHALRVIKDDFAAIGNFLRINSAVPFPQLNGAPSRVRARNFVFPVNGHARESWMLASERLRDQKQRDQDCRN